MAGIFQTFGQEEVCRSVLKVFPPVAVEGTHTYGIFFADIFEGDVFGKVNVHIGDDLIYLGIFFRGEVDRFLGEHDFADEVLVADADEFVHGCTGHVLGNNDGAGDTVNTALEKFLLISFFGGEHSFISKL